jgi:hypothetical protein
MFLIEYTKYFTYADLKKPKATKDQIFELEYEEVDDYVKLLKSRGVPGHEIKRKLEKLKSDNVLTWARVYSAMIGTLGAGIPAILLKSKYPKLAIATGILGGGLGLYGGWKLGTRGAKQNNQIIDLVLKDNNIS